MKDKSGKKVKNNMKIGSYNIFGINTIIESSNISHYNENFIFGSLSNNHIFNISHFIDTHE